MSLVFEVCVDSYEGALSAVGAGANRLEICSALSLGGLTPSGGLLSLLASESFLGMARGVERFVMIRPRSGDFNYSECEFDTMLEEIRLVKALGFDGIVIGFVQSNGAINFERTQQVVTFAKPMQVVFHRAFDMAREPETQIKGLIDAGVCRILTSGAMPTATEGADLIRRLQNAYGHLITIMPGSGVNSDNLEWLQEYTGCEHFHFSAKAFRPSEMSFWPDWYPRHTRVSECENQYTSSESVRQVVNLNRKHGGNHA